MARRLKASVDRYRTFNGETYLGWLAYAGDDRVAAYRKAGIRCRRLEGDLLVHRDDIAAALRIDSAINKEAISRST